MIKSMLGGNVLEKNKKTIEKIYKKNMLFIILIGIVGISFGLLDWDSNLVDLFYLKYKNAFLVSIISANIGTARLLATLFCIKINSSRRPNFVFITCMILCSIFALITAICFDLKLIIPFVIVYLLEVLLLEVFSGYHYAYAYNSLPEEKAMNAHSKRIAVFKTMSAAGIAIAGIVCAKYINNAFLIISVLAIIVFGIAILFVKQVKNYPKENDKNHENLLKKLNIFTYTPYFRKWFLVRILERFALSSLVVLLSLKALDIGESVLTLKTIKTFEFILSGIGFFLASYFIKKKSIIKGDIILKIFIALLIPIALIRAYVGLIIILLYGILESFNAMSQLEMLRKDKDKINLPQKDMIINFMGYIAKMMSAFILINIDMNISLITIVIILIFSTVFEFKLYRSKSNEI